MELSELVTHIRGDKGTTVHMQIAREGEADYLELDIERDKVEVPTVTSEMLDNHIGYIAIRNLQSRPRNSLCRRSTL